MQEKPFRPGAERGASSTPAAQADLIPREVLFGNPTRTSPRLSPDGRRLAYLAPDEGVLNVWVRECGSDEDRVVTRDRSRGIRSFFWVYDRRHLIYLQDREGDEDWHLWSVDVDSGIIRDLTPFLGVQARLIALDPHHPEQMLVGLNLRDARLHDVYRIEIATGAVTLVAENPGAAMGWMADRKLRVRVRQDATPDGGFAAFFRDDEQSPWREIARWPMEENGGVVGFSPDESALYLTDSRGRDTTALVEMDMRTGALTLLAHDREADVGGVRQHPTTREIQAVSWEKARMERRFFDASFEESWKEATQIDRGEMSLVSRDLADRTWVLAFVQDDGPVRYHLFRRGSAKRERIAKEEFLFAHRDDLEGLDLLPMESIEYTSRDGLKIQGYLTRPREAAAGPVPMVLHPHGGPWSRDSWGFNPVCQWLGNRGYAVLQVNFRGSTGFGKAFLRAGDKQWGRGSMQHDLSDAVEWAITEGIADRDRIAIMGGSYGGYAALAGAAFTPKLYSAAVDIVGPSNLFTLIESVPPYWEPIRERFVRSVGDPEKDADFLKEISPLFHVDQIEIPLLIGQGANDPRVKEAESEQIVQAMRAAGRPVEYLLYPDEGHGFARPENRLHFYGHVEAFLATHLGGRAEPLPADGHQGTGYTPDRAPAEERS